jgi:hypothetical protein
MGFRTKPFSPPFPERNNPISALRMTVSIVYQAWRPQKLRVLDKDLPADHASAPQIMLQPPQIMLRLRNLYVGPRTLFGTYT